MLASEYGWGKDAILQSTALDEVLRLQESIKKRKLLDYRMRLVIQYTEKPGELLEAIDKELADPADQDLPGEELDKAGLMQLKNMMAFGSKFRIK